MGSLFQMKMVMGGDEGGGGPDPDSPSWGDFTLPTQYGQAGVFGEPNWAASGNMSIGGGTGAGADTAGNIIYQGRSQPPPDDTIYLLVDSVPDEWWNGTIDDPLGLALTIECTAASSTTDRDIDDVFTFNGPSTPGVGASDQIGQSLNTAAWRATSGSREEFGSFDGVGIWTVTADFEVTETNGGAFVDEFTAIFTLDMRAQPD